MRGLIKVHKEGTPIRPIVNWKNSPGYKLAQLLTKLITSHTPLPYTYNVKNNPTDERPDRNTTGTLHEICILRHKQYVLQYPHQCTNNVEDKLYIYIIYIMYIFISVTDGKSRKMLTRTSTTATSTRGTKYATAAAGKNPAAAAPWRNGTAVARKNGSW